MANPIDSFLFSTISFLFVLGVLVFIHEFGHFIVARLCGVGVKVFSFGFGPRLFGKKRDMTDYRVSAVPLGGYVRMVGEEVGSEVEESEIPLSFSHKSVWKRIAIVAAGPVFNFLLAVVIFFIIYTLSGMQVLRPTVGKVTPDSPAEAAGIRKGDEIIAVDDTRVESWTHMARLISESKGSELSISINRDNRLTGISVKPHVITDQNLFGEEIRRHVIGIEPGYDYKTIPVGIFGAAVESLKQTWFYTELTVLTVYKLVTGGISTKNLGGPIMIAQVSGKAARQGVSNLFGWIAVLSINLGFLNLLPIPILDGGHLLFFILEGIRGKPISERVREIALQTGFMLLMLLMVLVFYNDLTR